MKVKFKKLGELAVLPTYAKPGDAGLDITATTDGKFASSQNDQPAYYYIEYGTDLAVEIPEGYVGLLFPRSSISKTIMVLSNAVGVIDSSYRGEIKFRFKVDAGVIRNTAEGSLVAKYWKGDKIGQLIIVPYTNIEPEFEESLSETERGEGGFGSTDIKQGENV